MDQQRFDEADMLMRQAAAQQNGIIGLYRNLMVCDQMYVEMISERAEGDPGRNADKGIS